MIDDIERLRAQGHKDLTTVGEAIGDLPTAPTGAFVPATLPDTPAFPALGIYFGMPDEVYHAIPALSSSGVKKLAASPMLFWAGSSWLSDKKRRREAEANGDKAHQTMGKAYHCRIMEGRAAFDSRFVVALDPADFPNALVKTDQIKAAIGAFKEMVPVKPCGARKDDLAAQLEQLRTDNPPEGGIVVGLAPTSALGVAELKDRIREYLCEQPAKPVAKVADTLPSGEEYMRDAVKSDWIDQLLALDPEAEIFDRIQAAFLKEHAGKALISFEDFEQLEIAAAMIERDPEVQHAFKGGHAEVSLFWHCPVTGVPMKARVDYLKIKAMVDLKSVGNQRERSIENAIRGEIASYHYNIQPAVYEEGAKAVRDIVREHGASAVWEWDYVGKQAIRAGLDRLGFALKWASHRGGDEWLWVFQQKGDAPITRGVFYPLAGTTHMISCDIVLTAKRRFRKYSEALGIEPWLDTAPIYTIDDESIPQSATDI